MAGTKNDVVVGKNADFSQAGAPNATTSEANGLATDGQMWIGTTALNAGGTHINVGTLTSPGATVTIGYSSPNITLEAGAAVPTTFTGNSGVATPAANNLNVVTANTTVDFVGSGSTLTQDFRLNNLIIGSPSASLTIGINNVGLGFDVFRDVTSGQSNVAVGYNSLRNLTIGEGNACFGLQAGFNLTEGTSNTFVGRSAGSANLTGNNNTFIGNAAGVNISSGSDNIAIGFNSAANLSAGNSNNIHINNLGILGDSNVIKIGTQGSGTRQQNQCFIAGIVGVSPSNAQSVVINSSTGQLGVSTGSLVAWTVVTGTSQAAVSNNGYIANNAGLVTITLPATSAVGDTISVTGINNATGWRIAQNAGNQIFFGTSSTTAGVGGSLSSSATRDSVQLVCVTANAAWNVLNSVGNLTVV